MFSISPLQQQRLQFRPRLPKLLDEIRSLSSKPRVDANKKVDPQVASFFPKTYGQPFLSFVFDKSKAHDAKRVGVVFSGGQASGGHNVITGLYDALKKLNPGSKVFGFCDGPNGIIKNISIEITAEVLAPYRNQGGFDLIGSGRTKIETQEQFDAAEAAVRALDLDGLVIIGGDDSNTSAAHLAEYFAKKECKTVVVGVPKTIDGDLRNEEIEISFGFDSATKTFSEIIGNLLRDSLSAKKYYFFIKLMGRSASHITLECALQTHPNMALISEEVAAQNKTLAQLVEEICDMISARSSAGKEYGVVLIPEGIIEFIPECKQLIRELNKILVEGGPHMLKMAEMSLDEKWTYIESQLTPNAQQVLKVLPRDIQDQLFLDRDPYGNVQVSKIESERLFIKMVEAELKKRKKAGAYSGKFSPQALFCGYEGRSCFPSNFDAQYCYALGHAAALLIDEGKTGYICCIQNLVRPIYEWRVGALPITSMMTVEERKGKESPMVTRVLVNLQGKPFKEFSAAREAWKMEDSYRNPGPIQFSGPSEVTEAITITLAVERK